MTRRRRAALGLLPGLVLAVAWLLVPAATIAGDPCYHGFELPARTIAATNEVKVLPCAFGPTNAQVPVGGTVTFVNASDFTHLVTGANQEWGDRDAEIRPHAKVAYTFDKAGIYPYACALHRGMSGTIIVGTPAQAGLAAPVASTTTPPAAGDGTAPALLAGVAIGAALVGGAMLVLVARRRPTVEIEPVAQPGTTEPAPR
jgi:plastocyanin